MTTTSTLSGLYVGTVTHRRRSPVQHNLRYRTYSLLFDVDELAELAKRTTLLSHNGWNLYSVHDRDFGPRDGSPLRPWIDGVLANADIDLNGGSVQVLAFPRILGHTFNPLTMWFCHHADGSLRAVLYEIHNTFGHSHSHLVPIDSARSEPYRHEFRKELHVSPFFDQAGEYSFTLRPPGGGFSVAIDYQMAGEPLLTATMTGAHRPLSTASLLQVFASHPLLTMKIVFGIHWHALQLWAKGARYRPVPAEPLTKVSYPVYFEANDA